MIAVNYATKKAIKASIGSALRYTETSMFGPEYKANGTFPFVGPSAYKRVYYGTVTMKDGLIAKVQ